MSVPIREQMDALRQRSAQLDAEMLALQKRCKHPRVERPTKAYTGVYDPSSDSYWSEFTCPDCDLWWTEID